MKKRGGIVLSVLFWGMMLVARRTPSAYGQGNFPRYCCDGGFAAGFFQQIPVSPGGIYDANVQLILYDSYDKDDGGVGRKIGLDPHSNTHADRRALADR